jgi:hypothetical protein
MGKIIFSLCICVLFFVPCSEGSGSTPVSLWQSGQFSIQGVLPEDWKPLSPGELDVIISAMPGSITQQSGEVEAGFQLVSEKKSDNASQSPRIVIFVKTDEYVTLEMIQKTYAWFEKNKNLLAGMLPDKVEKASIQDIEYRQKWPAILFQNNLDVNDKRFTALSTIIFLKRGVLNIICITEEKEFAEFETVFHTFLESINIPPRLRHESAIDRPEAASGLKVIYDLLGRQWQPFLGVLLIIGVYGWVFRTGKSRG